MLDLRNPKVVFEKVVFKNVESDFYSSLRKAIAKEDVVAVTDEGIKIDYIHIAELKDVYGAYEDDLYEAIEINLILLCTETGAVVADIGKYGVVPLDNFDFVGSKKALNDFKITEIHRLVEKRASELMKKKNPYETRGLRSL